MKWYILAFLPLVITCFINIAYWIYCNYQDFIKYDKKFGIILLLLGILNLAIFIIFIDVLSVRLGIIILIVGVLSSAIGVVLIIDRWIESLLVDARRRYRVPTRRYKDRYEYEELLKQYYI